MTMTFITMGGWLATILFAQGNGELAPAGTPICVPLGLIALFLVIFGWYFVQRSWPKGPATPAAHNAHADHAAHEAAPAAAAATVETAPPPPPPTPAKPDNLTRIEGIGPKIGRLLNGAGIKTFAELANTSVATLEKIVQEDAGLEFINPESWPEQAALAAAGDWEALKVLQADLKGGRRQ